MSPLRACLFVSLLGSACTVAPPRDLTFAAAAPQDRAPTDAGRWGERVVVDGIAIPVAQLTLDFDGLADNSRSEDGSGYGARVGIGDAERSAGVMFQALRSDDDLLDANVVLFDFDVRASLESEVPMFFARAGAGIGIGWLDTTGDDAGGRLASQLRLGLDFQPVPWFAVNTSICGILFGSPGETEAYGTFLSVGAVLVF
jgi:hypothetical protein